MSVDRIVAALEHAGVAVLGVVPKGARLEGLAVGGVQQDSRSVGPGDLFVAWAGASRDAHDFLGAAASAGARAAIVERQVPGAGIPQLQVDNARLAAAVAAGFVAGSPWPDLRTVGVTGTNGKTTTTFLLRGLLGRDARAAAIGTLGLVGPNGRIREDTGLTTPGPVRIAGLLSELSRAGVDSVVVETSSHALDQFRLDGIRFDAMAFTNLTRDHLDYHGTFERYLAAKARLLELGREGATAVINADDPAWGALRPPGPVLTYGIGGGADVRARALRLSARGCRFDLVAGGRRVPVTLALPGRFNVYNALCAAGCALALGRSPEAVAEGLGEASPVPGRLERIADEPFAVLVDFAHTPDALDQVAGTLRPLVEGRLIVVFGAGGDRDATKRPEMGAAVARHADLAVVTSDNPRSEDPATIAAQVAQGVSGCDSAVIVDRLDAIHWALDRARPGDAVLLAGKGHEAYQEIGGERRPFDERAIVREHLSAGGDA